MHHLILTETTPLAGASAGALAVAAFACKVPSDKSMRIVYRVEKDIRESGAFLRLHSLLTNELENLLPADAHVRINQRPAKTTISYTRVWPGIRGKFVNHFSTREDLTQCLTASCNIPFYFSTWPTVTCRGTQAVDGYFASSATFGCPPTSAHRDIYVLPFPAKKVRFKVPVRNCISPDLQQFDNLLNCVSHGQFSRQLQAYIQDVPVTLAESNNEEIFSSSAYGATIDSSTEKMVSKIADLWNIPTETADEVASNVTNAELNLPVLKYSVNKLLMIALSASKDEHLAELFDLGRSDAFRWIQLEHYTANNIPDIQLGQYARRLKRSYLYDDLNYL